MEASPSSADKNRDVFDATMQETREVLASWRRSPLPVIGRWWLVSFAIACFMLIAVLGVSHLTTAQPTGSLPIILGESQFSDVVRLFFRNFLVLALHAFVCLAGFLAMRALPEQVQYKRGVDRWIHEHAGPAAMIFVSAATLFSICTQTLILGRTVADISLTIDISQAELLLTALPHALLELSAVFLPLAAFLMASRSGKWHELLAATIVTTAVALPMIAIAACLEAYLWPHVLRGILT